MDQASALRSTLAGFLGISADTLTPDFSLGATKLNSSIQRAMLYAQLRSQAGLSVRGMPTFKTFGDLESQLLGRSATSSVASQDNASVLAAAQLVSRGAQRSAWSKSGINAQAKQGDPLRVAANQGTSSAAFLNDGESPIACGIDIESVSALPAASDYWEHEFYTSHFTREEIAYCLLQSRPAVHLAGRWCVKEALKKCDPKFLSVAMNQIEIRQDAAGAPAIWDLTNGPKRLPHAASLAHTDDFAVGTVVRLSSTSSEGASISAEQSRTSSPSIAPTNVNMSPPPQGSRNSARQGNLLPVAGILIALAAMALSIYSMWRH